MLRALLIGLVTTIVLTAATPKEPTLKWKGSNHYLAINPLLSHVEMTISCGQDFEKPVIQLSPRTQEELDIKEPSDNPAPTCFIESWKKLK